MVARSERRVTGRQGARIHIDSRQEVNRVTEFGHVLRTLTLPSRPRRSFCARGPDVMQTRVGIGNAFQKKDDKQSLQLIMKNEGGGRPRGGGSVSDLDLLPTSKPTRSKKKLSSTTSEKIGAIYYTNQSKIQASTAFIYSLK